MTLTDLQRANFRHHSHTSDQVIDPDTGDPIEPGGGALDSDLTDIAALAPAANDFLQFKSSHWANRTVAQVLTDLGIAAAYQPLDSDLTAIAALTTTTFGRSLLALADAAAVRSEIGAMANPMTTGGDTMYGQIGGTTNYGTTALGASASQAMGDGQTWQFGSANGPLSASATYGDQSYEIRGQDVHAVNGSLYTVDLGQPRLIGQVKVGTRDAGYRAYTIKVESSTDNTNWTLRSANPATLADNADALVTVTPTTARYWRLTGLSGPAAWWMINRVQFLDADGGAVLRLAAGADDTTYQMNGGLPAWRTPAQARVAMGVSTRTVEFVIDGGGSTITTGVKGDVEVPFAWTNITSARLLADQSGAIVVNVWKDTYANFPPVVGDKITASAPPTISASGTKSEDTTLTGWTKTGSAGDILRFNVDSVTSITRVTLSLVLVV